MAMFCETSESIEAAVTALSQAPYLFLDCEGRDLGTTDGKLSILSLGTPHAKEVFLVDFLKLSSDDLQPLLTLLGGDKVRKVVWDGRMDFSELFHAYGTAIDVNVLDLQVVDIKSRLMRRQSEYMRKRRLSRRDFPLSEVEKLQVADVYGLNSLNYALKEHLVATAAPKEGKRIHPGFEFTRPSPNHPTTEFVTKIHNQNESEKWLERPIPEVLLQYAANDILRIAGMYDKFVERGYILEAHLDAFVAQSTRYVGMFRNRGRPAGDNPFLRSGIMPLHVFGPDTDEWKGAKELWACKRCSNVLPVSYFPVVPRTDRRLDSCRVCTLILAREAYKLKYT